LRPGVRGVSSRIRVRSVIGRFLEHSRIFVFGNGGDAEVYLGSADWMHRNIYERVEVMFHVNDAALRERILREVVAPYLADTEKTRVLMPDGRYLRARDAGGPRYSQNGWRFNVQQFLIDSVQRQPEGEAFPALPRFLEASVANLSKLRLSHRSSAVLSRATRINRNSRKSESRKNAEE
jgi:polyphosphate kinase